MILLAMLFPALAAPRPAVLTPDRPGDVSPERAFDLARLRLDLALDPAGAVEGTATFTVTRLSPGPLVLDQVALDIQSVDAGEVGSRWWVEGDHLLVDLDGDAATVRVAYAAHPRAGLHFRRDEGFDARPEIWSQGEDTWNRHWFPGWDAPDDRFVYEGHITAPAGWTVLTNANVELVNYLVAVAAGAYEEHVHPAEPAVSVWVPPGTSPEAVARVLDPVPAMMRHFAERTGAAYPFPSYRQVFVQRFMFTGMENTTLTVMDEKLLVQDRVATTRGPGVESTVAHELAHQWFGDLLTCRTWREMWLNEGFATFMAADWDLATRGEADYAADVQRWRAGNLGEQNAMARRFHRPEDAPDSSQVYGKGALTLHMLRVLLGEEVFWAGIRRYVAENAPGNVETVDLRRALEAVSGRDLAWFFQQWVELPHVPRLTVESGYDGEVLTVTVRQERTDQRPLYTLPVEVEVGTPDGPVVLRGLLTRESLGLDLPLREAPRYVAFDPRGGVLAAVEQAQGDGAWAAQLVQASTVLARLEAARALGETDESEALAGLLADRAAPGPLRQAAADALGEQRALVPLLSAAADEDDRVRRSVAAALGRCPGDEATRTLERIARGDANPDVHAAALRSLGSVAPARALALARTARLRRGYEDSGLVDASLDVLGEHGDARDLPLLLNRRLFGRGIVSGLGAAARLAVRLDHPPPLLDDATRLAVPLLADPDIRTRQAAARALAELGDAGAVDHLERFRRVEQAVFLREIANDSVAAIRSRADAPAAPARADARLDEALERIEALEAEVERWSERR